MGTLTPAVGTQPPVYVGGPPSNDPVSLLLRGMRWIAHRLHHLAEEARR
jgi:hypothetical protein